MFLSASFLIAWKISNNGEESLQRPSFEIVPDGMNACLLIQVQPPKIQVYSLVLEEFILHAGMQM